MTDFEKALNGYVFKMGGRELAEMRERARDLCFDYNNLRPSDTAGRRQIMNRLLGATDGSFSVISPFYCDYGCFIRIGKDFFANYNCKILDGGPVVFGDNVLIGPDCTFATPSHMLDPAQRLEKLEVFLPISVGSNVWFSANVTVLGGVTIGDNSVIAAGSVVTRDIPAGCLAMGTPCRAVRELNESDRGKYPFHGK